MPDFLCTKADEVIENELSEEQYDRINYTKTISKSLMKQELKK